MKLYNTLTRKKEQFLPRHDKRVNLFVCGPTVYDYSHIGHARTYLAYDAMVKFFRKKMGWEVFYLQNITDIDDKIIERASELNKDPLLLANEFEETYYQDTEALEINSVDQYARATEHIPEIISQIQRFLDKKIAYKIEDDGIYFDVSTFKNYGKLAGRTTQQAEDAISRIDQSINKRNKADFALWKFSKRGEPSWPSSFGDGRPGWHIEDTAITEKYFGPQYDLHGGAIDLIFPHHEAEIALMESLSGIEPMVKIWIHAGFLTVNGQKMSKSEDNFITIRNLLDKYSTRALRMFVFSTHYRSPLDYNEPFIKEAQQRIERIDAFLRRIREYQNKDDGMQGSAIEEKESQFWQALEDDFNTPKAFAILFDLINQANKEIDTHTLSPKDKQELLDLLGSIDGIFNILPQEKQTIPNEIKELVNRREQARKEENFDLSDSIRKDLQEKGYGIEDTDSGSRIYKL